MIKKSNSTEKTTPTDSQYGCLYCKRTFVRESTLASHLCESKRRFLDKDRPGNRIGFVAFTRFYKFNTNSKAKNQADFISSAYYLAFVKFGNYCAETGVIGVERYVDWLLHNKIKIDNWASDTVYKKFLVEYLRQEDAFDALERSVETLIKLSADTSILSCDYLRWGNRNRICQQISAGRISPWLMYQSSSGREFLDTLNEDELKIVIDYINPELWALHFNRHTDTVGKVKEILSKGGF